VASVPDTGYAWVGSPTAAMTEPDRSDAWTPRPDDARVEPMFAGLGLGEDEPPAEADAARSGPRGIRGVRGGRGRRGGLLGRLLGRLLDPR